jgi:RNA polymerase sigma-70 factor, ECF subfamily
MPTDVTRLLGEWKAGRSDAREELISLTYEELRRLARAYLRRERVDHTLQPTALLNEAYLRLLPSGPRTADSRDAFFRLMASEMRHRLVDHARRRLAEKRGSGAKPSPLDTSAPVAAPAADEDDTEVLDRLDRAVADLAAGYPRAAKVVQLRFFAGLTTDETAGELRLSPGTVKREWTFARAWLAAALAPTSQETLDPS